jgi:hypothetical protein
MEYQSLIRLNKYPRSAIKSLTGIVVENQSVICVGNTMERIKLESAIVAHTTCNVSGKGKMTAILEVVDRLNLPYKICYNGKPTWEDAPIVDTDTIYIVRNPSKPLEGCINLFDSPPQKLKCIHLLPMTAKDITEYERLKGMPSLQFPLPTTKENEMQIVGQYLRSGGEQLPKNYDMWLVRNFYTNPQVLELLLLTTKTTDKTFKKALLDMIKIRRPVALKYPVWVKMR